MKFFVDNNIGHQFVDGMRGFTESLIGVTKIIHLKEKFNPNVKDVDWLRFAGENNYFVISKDNKMRYKPQEKKELSKNNIGAFIVRGKGSSSFDIIRVLVYKWPDIIEKANHTKKPFIFSINVKTKRIDKFS